MDANLGHQAFVAISGHSTPYMKTLDEAFDRVERFKRDSLRRTINAFESALQGAQKAKASRIISEQVEADLLGSALLLKKASAQINEVVHSVGILISIPLILEPQETIEYLSLAAGNTGRRFDLVTDHRIAEFKFIDWKGGPESIRQNSLFKDFFDLAEHETKKQKFLYVVGLKHPMKFFMGRRACQSVMSRNVELWHRFSAKYGKQYRTVCEFYDSKKSDVRVVDLTSILPELAALADIVERDGDSISQ
jgi:hypothetical protein